MIKSKLSILFIAMLTMACSNDNNNESEQEINEETTLIGKWHVSDIKAYDQDIKEVELPRYINIDCESKTEYTFFEDGTFLEENDMYWDNHVDNTFDCYVDDEGGGFDTGVWTLLENNELDLKWVYNNGASDSEGWIIEFVNINTFKVFHDKDQDEPPYGPDYYYFYSRIE